MPKPLSLINQVEQVEFCTKPAAGIVLINSGLAFRDYWTKKTLSEVVALHSRLTATASKVISSMIIESSNPSEARVGE